MHKQISPIKEKTNIKTRKKILNALANEFAQTNPKWRFLFEYSKTKGLEAWEVVSLIFLPNTGISLSEKHFEISRIAKLLATTEKEKVDESLVTKADLVNWNRFAISALIEAEKQRGNDKEKIQIGYKTIELINILFPGILIDSPKSSPFPKW